MRCRLAAAAALGLVLVSALPASAGARSAHATRVGRELVLVSARTGAVDRSFPDVNCCVEAVSADGHGGWFIAGEFTRVGKKRVAGIARLHPNGTLDTRWHGRLPRKRARGLASHLVRRGHTLYVGSAAWVEALDARTGARRWLVRLHATGGGGDLAASRTTVFVGGVPGRSPVALDTRTGRRLPWHAQLPPKYPDAYALALDGDRLFVGLSTRNGYFETVRAVDTRTGRLTSWEAPQIKEVGSMFVTHGLLFTVGLDNRYVVSTQTGKPVRALARISGAVYAAAGDTLYAGGDCRGGSTFAGRRRDNLGAVDLRTDKVTSWAPRIGTKYVCVQAIAADAEQVLVAGSFTRSLD